MVLGYYTSIPSKAFNNKVRCGLDHGRLRQMAESFDSYFPPRNLVKPTNYMLVCDYFWLFTYLSGLYFSLLSLIGTLSDIISYHNYDTRAQLVRITNICENYIDIFRHRKSEVIEFTDAIDKGQSFSGGLNSINYSLFIFDDVIYYNFRARTVCKKFLLIVKYHRTFYQDIYVPKFLGFYESDFNSNFIAFKSQFLFRHFINCFYYGTTVEMFSTIGSDTPTIARFLMDNVVTNLPYTQLVDFIAIVLGTLKRRSFKEKCFIVSSDEILSYWYSRVNSRKYFIRRLLFSKLSQFGAGQDILDYMIPEEPIKGFSEERLLVNSLYKEGNPWKSDSSLDYDSVYHSVLTDRSLDNHSLQLSLSPLDFSSCLF